MAQARVEIIADIKKALSSLESLEKQGKETGDRIKSSFDGLKTAAAAFVGAFAVGKVISSLSSLASEASVAEEALNNMKTALALSGQFSAEAVTGLNEFATELQRTTKFGDDVIQGQLALALNYGLTTDQAKELVKASADLSAVTGKDLNDATQLLLKSYDGEIGKIDNLSPKIKTLTKEQLANGEAVKILLDQYSGAAASQAATFAGQMAQLTNTFGDLREEIGFTITQNPQVLEAINSLKIVFQGLIEGVAKNKDAIGDFVSNLVIFASTTIPLAIRGIGLFVKAVEILETSIASAAQTFVQLIRDFGTSSIGKALGLESLNKDLKTLKISLDPDAVTAKYAVLNGAIDGTATLFEQMAENVSKAKDQTKKMDDQFKKTSDNVNKTVKLTREQQLALDEVNKKAAELRKITDKQEEIYKTILGENKKISTEISNQGEEQNIIIQNNLKLALEQLDVKQQELKTQGLLNSAIEDQIAAQRGLLSSKAREDILSQKPEADPNFGKEEAKKDNQFISQDTIDTIGQAFGEGAGAIASSVSSFVTPLTSFMSAAEAVVGVVQKLIDFIPNLLNSIANIFTSLTALPQTILEALKNVFASLASFIGDFLGNLVSGLGDIIISAFQFLLEGLPNALIKLAQSLPAIIAETIPKVIEGLIGLLDNLGPIIENLVVALADATPLIVEALVDSLITDGGIIRIAYAFGKAIAVDVPIALARGFIKAVGSLASNVFPGLGKLFSSGIKVPIPDWISKLSIKTPEWLGKFETALKGGKLVEVFQTIISKFDALIDAIKKITGQGGGGTLGKLKKGDVGGALDTALGGDKRRKILGFADGGSIPAGFPLDTFPARLSSGENVVDRSTNEKLNAFLDGGAQTPIQIVLKVGEQELANIIYGLNKKGFRLA